MQLYHSNIMSKKHLISTVVFLALILGNLFFAANYFLILRQLKSSQKELQVQQTNRKIVNFLNLFIQKVLKTDEEVPFEDRLKLENTIRDIGDEELLSKWEKFTGTEMKNASHGEAPWIATKPDEVIDYNLALYRNKYGEMSNV